MAKPDYVKRTLVTEFHSIRDRVIEHGLGFYKGYPLNVESVVDMSVAAYYLGRSEITEIAEGSPMIVWVAIKLEDLREACPELYKRITGEETVSSSTT